MRASLFLFCSLKIKKTIQRVSIPISWLEVLARISAILQSLELTDKDLVASYGGEEFAILLLNRGIDKSVKIAEELIEKLANEQIEHIYSKVRNYITVSIGVATMVTEEGRIASSLLLKADEALYKEKESGRNIKLLSNKKERYCFSSNISLF